MEGLMMGGVFYSRQSFFEKADKLVLTFLVKYAKENGKTLFIIPSSTRAKHSFNRLENEMHYYNDLLGNAVEFLEGAGVYAAYNAVDSTEVVVGIDSTLNYESTARGNKTAIFSIRGRLVGVNDRDFGYPESYPDEGPFWTNRPDSVVFERILDHLFAINDEQWEAELEETGFVNIMAYDPGNTILQSVLEKELGPPNHKGVSINPPPQIMH